MLGLRRATAGTVELLGGRPADLAIRRRCGVMLQESGLPKMLEVAEVLRLFRAHYPRPRPLAEVLEMANLTDRARRRVDSLSGGERQRLNYAISICGDPELLFLDEPTVGMDVASRHRFYDALTRTSASGRTILLATHYLEEADRLASRILVVDRGRIVMDGTPAEVKARVPGKRVTLAARRPLAAPDFADLPLRALELHDHAASFLSTDPVAVLRGLVQRDVPLADIEVTGALLEDAFPSLTGARREG
jgi:ABC-2 type transport system ATP-binding protein